MADFDTVGDQLEEEIQSKGSKTRTIINRSIVAALAQLARYRTLFMEGDFSVSTSDGLASAFGGSPTGFPANIQMIDALWWSETTGTNPTRWPIKMTPSLDDVLFSYYNGFAQSQAKVACYHHERLVFAPKWGGVYTLGGWYFKDARRNTADGALITTSSTTQTNGWFVDGLLCLKALAASIALASPYLRNEAAAGPQIALYQAEIRRLGQEYRQKTGFAAQAPRYQPVEGRIDRLTIEGLSYIPPV